MTIPSRPNDLTHEEIKRLIGHEAPVILEIGCNDGTDTQRFLDSYADPRVYCFECDPRPIARWREKITDPRATLFEFALDETCGVSAFNQSTGSPRPGVTDWDLSGSLCKPTGHLTYSPWCEFKDQIAVTTHTLDSWAKHNIADVPVVDFIWIDTQGAERRIFRGGPETLAKTRLIKTECHRSVLYDGAPTEAELIAFFAGWRCLGRFADDLLFHNLRFARA